MLLCSTPLAQAAAALPDAAALVRLQALDASGNDAISIPLPTGADSQSIFSVSDSGTLPLSLMRRHPGLRSFRGYDTAGRTVRIDTAAHVARISVTDDGREYAYQLPLAPGRLVTRPAGGAALPARGRRRGLLADTNLRIAVATTSRFTAAFGETQADGLAVVAHWINRANEIFERDVGVHFTLADRSDRLIFSDARRDPFLRQDPGPTAVQVIDYRVGADAYDVGHVLTTFPGGESLTGTSCSNDASGDFFQTHKAAAWSGDSDPASTPRAFHFMLHVLGKQLGAWPTANGCMRPTLDDRAFEPGSGSTLMGWADTACGGVDQQLQRQADRYFHGASIQQMRAWLSARGGQCARKTARRLTSPWIRPESTAAEAYIPARTPFWLEADVEAGRPGGTLTYAWDPMDTGAAQAAALLDDGQGPLFRSFPPAPTVRRNVPQVQAPGAPPASGERLPETNRTLDFLLTVRERHGHHVARAHARRRLHVIDTGRPFGLSPQGPETAGTEVGVRWDPAGTTSPPISCHFVDIALSLDGGGTWPQVLAREEANDGRANVILPVDAASSQARLRVSCDGRPFFAMSPQPFVIRPRAGGS